jgi:methionyl-tRNA synthetase
LTRHLVTSALPYANGPIHFGHVIGAYLPADVYARTLRMQGEEVLFVCGTDEYGTAITINAEQAGVPYPEYVARWRAEIKATLDRFGIEFDIWSGTSVCPEHAETSRWFFSRLFEQGWLFRQDSEQLYCPKDQRFLADRYVVGTCYVCGFEEARGNECPRCGNELDPLRMARATCKTCGTVAEKRPTWHWYLDLPKLRDAHIGEWFRSKRWKPNVAAFVENQLADLQPRPITRDMSWGITLPEPLAHGARDKVLYVWFDAPIGYVSMTREWARQRGTPEAWKDWWQSPDTRLVHFIGKDNIPFHCIYFPSMLWGVQSGFVLPWQVPANEFYNLQGRKFSTSGNWTVSTDAFFARYDAEAARFYLLASAPETADSDWRWQDFQACVNAQLADTIGNLVTRVLRFVDKHWEGRIPPLDPAHEAALDRQILAECGAFGDPALHVREFRFRRAAEQLIANATVANVFVDRSAPWALRKSDPVLAASVLNTCCEWLGWLARWMAPMMPGKGQALWRMLGAEGEVADERWPGVPVAGAWRSLPAGRRLGAVEGLFAKIDDETITREVESLDAGARSHP